MNEYLNRLNKSGFLKKATNVSKVIKAETPKIAKLGTKLYDVVSLAETNPLKNTTE